ncbi:MAG: class I SAM-dependent methyltransferase [Lachnospiraceae bacterium]|nr:class I SAM-dependent methyltransferase [Lachnospiraceae bacterium]
MNSTKEAIGNVVLNYKYYSGKDLYSEGAGEDILLNLVKEHDEDAYPHVIQNTKTWSVMYHLSPERENICSFLPIKKTDRVLEIGSGCGAITGCLSRLAGYVTCIELSAKRSTINAYRHKSMDNIEILVGNFEDIEQGITEKYDYITLIGVLEYAESYINSPDPYREILRRVKRHLNKNGKLIIAIENQLGLKYFAGCKEDHTGTYFEGIEGYTNTEGVRTFSKKTLTELLKDCGYGTHFYYPYPDYKLPHTIYSDAWLPKTGELNDNIRNFDADRMVTFDETKVYDSLIREGLFSEFSNSFLVMATPEEIPSDEMLPVFAKYSGQRAPQYRMATVIYSDAAGRRNEVYKLALNPAANDHVDDIYVNYLKLNDAYEGTGLKPNVCRRLADTDELALADTKDRSVNACVNLEYLEGMTMEEYLDILEDNRDYERMLLLMKQYESVLSSVNNGTFANSPEFKEMFGEDIEGEYKGAPVSDIDLIFTNIVFDRDRKENGQWNVLDYEWTMDYPVPFKYVMFRALYYYIQTHKDSGFLKYIRKRGSDLYSQFDISNAERELFTRLERNFQLNIIKGAASLKVMHELMSVMTVDVQKATESVFRLRDLKNPKIYYGTGRGFSNENRYQMFAMADDNRVSIEIPMEPDVTELRIDPTEYPCIVKIKSIVLGKENKEEEVIDRFLTNGYPYEPNTLVFDTDDAQIQFFSLPKTGKVLKIEYEISAVSDDVFAMLKDLALSRWMSSNRDLALAERIIDKIRRREREVIPQGLWYNK